jgi:hypothetical protein
MIERSWENSFFPVVVCLATFNSFNSLPQDICWGFPTNQDGRSLTDGLSRATCSPLRVYCSLWYVVSSENPPASSLAGHDTFERNPTTTHVSLLESAQSKRIEATGLIISADKFVLLSNSSELTCETSVSCSYFVDWRLWVWIFFSK